jgi:hypothetical protein
LLQCLPYATYDAVAKDAKATAKKTMFYAISLHVLVDEELD